jgi:hypothetical protein
VNILGDRMVLVSERPYGRISCMSTSSAVVVEFR